jgi:precorrin-6B methylase 2
MVDMQTAKAIFEVLYNDVNGYIISSQSREKLGYHDKAHTYGEVTPGAFRDIVSRVHPKQGEVFYDLGSGTGKAVILASLLFDFSKCVGVEILKGLHQTAESIAARYERELKEHLPAPAHSTVELLNKDFLTCDLQEADIIFTHSTCFYDELWSQLQRKFEHLKSGTRIITVTKTLNSEHMEHLHTGEYGMNWGKATVHFYRHV